MTISTLVFVFIKVFWRTEMARIMEISCLRPFEKHFLLHWSVGGDAVLQLLYVWDSILSCFWYVFFLSIEFWVNYISLSILRCGASVLWLTLFYMPNMLSFSFLFYCVCFSFWLHFFDCFKQWIIIHLWIVVLFLVFELIELLC